MAWNRHNQGNREGKRIGRLRKIKKKDVKKADLVLKVGDYRNLSVPRKMSSYVVEKTGDCGDKNAASLSQSTAGTTYCHLVSIPSALSFPILLHPSPSFTSKVHEHSISLHL